MSKKVGLREQHKLDKLKRIRSAARELFLEKGYEKTTTRKVAEIAGVSHATVFLYAKDKRDLLFLVFNDDLDAVLEEAQGRVEYTGSLVDELLHLLRPYYTYFARDPKIGLLGIHEYSAAITSHDGEASVQMQRVKQRAYTVVNSLCEIIDACKAAGTVSSEINTLKAARVIRALYLAEMDYWMLTVSESLDVEQGLSSLREALDLLFVGLKAHSK